MCSSRQLTNLHSQQLRVPFRSFLTEPSFSILDSPVISRYQLINTNKDGSENVETEFIWAAGNLPLPYGHMGVWGRAHRVRPPAPRRNTEAPVDLQDSISLWIISY